MTASLAAIARAVRTTREEKGLSQRALSKKAGLTQAQISKIENAGDARLSSAVELARALDLEIVLVPRKLLPAVQSLARTIDRPERDIGAERTRRAYALDDQADV